MRDNIKKTARSFSSPDRLCVCGSPSLICTETRPASCTFQDCSNVRIFRYQVAHVLYFWRDTMHDILAQQFKTEVTRLGVVELRTPEEVDALMAKEKGTVLVFVNSVCGC